MITQDYGVIHLFFFNWQKLGLSTTMRVWTQLIIKSNIITSHTCHKMLLFAASWT